MWKPQASRIQAGWRDIDPAFLNTPTFEAKLVDAGSVRTIFKDERTSPIRSFKGRGADLFLRTVPEQTALVCASAGNFGQGLAWAARRRGHRLTVFCAHNAATCKIDAIRSLGAEVVLDGRDFDEAKQAAREFAACGNYMFVEDGAHVEIAEGAGTIGLELTRDVGELDAVYIPLGNGSLAAGVGCWFKAVGGSTRIVAVAALGAPAMGQAIVGEQAEPICETIADGIAVRCPIQSAVEAVQMTVDDVVFVSDDEISRAMRIIETMDGSVVEAAGAVGLAGFLASKGGLAGARVAIPITGGNRDLVSTGR